MFGGWGGAKKARGLVKNHGQCKAVKSEWKLCGLAKFVTNFQEELLSKFDSFHFRFFTSFVFDSDKTVVTVAEYDLHHFGVIGLRFIAVLAPTNKLGWRAGGSMLQT